MHIAPKSRGGFVQVVSDPQSVSWARRHTRETLTGWFLPQVIDDAELVVSELVTNAVNATCDPALCQTAIGRQAWITLALFIAQESLVIEVSDANSNVPIPRQAGVDDESGRGWSIIDMLTSYHDTVITKPYGKIVRAFLLLGDSIPALVAT